MKVLLNPSGPSANQCRLSRHPRVESAQLPNAHDSLGSPAAATINTWQAGTGVVVDSITAALSVRDTCVPAIERHKDATLSQMAQAATRAAAAGAAEDDAPDRDPAGGAVEAGVPAKGAGVIASRVSAREDAWSRAGAPHARLAAAVNATAHRCAAMTRRRVMWTPPFSRGKGISDRKSGATGPGTSLGRFTGWSGAIQPLARSCMDGAARRNATLACNG